MEQSVPVYPSPAVSLNVNILHDILIKTKRGYHWYITIN